jgi:predicted nucleic acid-binding protein
MSARMRVFIDTNIFMYIQRTDEAKKTKIAEKTIEIFDCVASTQVLNEISNLLTRKFPSPKEKVIRVLNSIKEDCSIVTITSDFPDKALEYHYRFSISYYDSLMIAAAIEANCTYLISEDMQDGLIIDGKLQIVNIFLHTDLLIGKSTFSNHKR